MKKPNPPYNRWLSVKNSRVKKVRLHRNGVVDVVMTGTKVKSNPKSSNRHHKKRRNQEGGLIGPVAAEAKKLAALFGVPFTVAMRVMQQTGGDVQAAFDKLTHIQAAHLADLLSVPITTATTVLKQAGGDVGFATSKLMGAVFNPKRRAKKRRR